MTYNPKTASFSTSVAEQAHLLVVDDDKRLRDLLRQYLQGCGFGVSLACNAAEARQLLSTLRFDLVIVDILMPGESGLDLARSLQERENLPVLILSALGEPADRLQGLELGVADYMAKPFEPRELFLRVSKILSQEPKHALLPSRLKVGDGNLKVATICWFPRNGACVFVPARRKFYAPWRAAPAPW